MDSIGLSDEQKHMVLQGRPIESVSRPAREEREAKETAAAPEPELSAEEKRIRQLEKQVSRMRSELDEKDEKIRGLEGTTLKSCRIPWLCNSPNYKIENLRKKLKGIELMQDLWARAADGEILPVGVFPMMHAGMTLMKRTPRAHDIKSLKKAHAVFVSAEYANELKKQGIVAFSDGAVRCFGAVAYISKQDFAGLKEKESVRIEDIVGQYRKSRGE
ncbi:MAG: hypothetical protein MSIBF_04700 [Candidatus Altiarchaeales archaeon IMC4]|nr:MAG: hypothetical protein MSIBF_04700 [Candidatus Altiarchaeales archaeon IMC4]